MLKPEFEKLNRRVKAAGDILMHYFGEQLHLIHKSTNADYRTRADVEAEEAIIGAIEEIFPDYNILAEERGRKEKNSSYTFIIDPLDGTNNFVLGVPAFSSSVALMKDGAIIYGLVYHPVTGDSYYAEKGKGAFLNGMPISVNSERKLQNITVTYIHDYTAPRHRTVKCKTALWNLGIKRHLDLWSPAFCYCGLACGRIEGVINDGMELYDFAAGKLIAVEAGAKVTGFGGEPIDEDTNGTFLITNGAPIHDILVDRVTRTLDGVKGTKDVKVI